MGMKNKLGMLGIMSAMMAMNGTDAYGLPNTEEPKEETEEQKKLRLKKIEKKLNKDKGLTEFFYGENSVWALNQKSADKKARKKGYL